MVSDVYFMNDRANSVGEAIHNKAVKVLRDAGIEELVKKGDTVGLKIHMGEYGNALNLRPQWVRSIADEIKRIGGKPVVVDCTTICFNEFTSRATLEDHLRSVAYHGFTEETLGCPIWICDGDYGFDHVKVDVPNGVGLKYSYMGKKLLDLDAVIVISHFKGHPMGVFGGAIKNVGIGMGSKLGKLCTHYLNHPVYGREAMTVNQEAARAANEGPSPNLMDRLIKNCPFDAMSWEDEMLKYDWKKCRKCAACFGPGLFNGILQPQPEVTFFWAPTISDAFAAYVNAIGPDKFLYVSYAMDVTPWCDCVNFHDKAMVPNLGVFASKDPVAIDMACLEAAEEMVGMPESKVDDFGFDDPETERFTNCSGLAKVSQWAQINAAKFNGCGDTEYRLIESAPAPDTDFWFEPYTPENPWGYANREALRQQDWEVGKYYEDTTKVSVPELFKKPKGKVEDLSITDLDE